MKEEHHAQLYFTSVLHSVEKLNFSDNNRYKGTSVLDFYTAFSVILLG